MQRKLEPLLSSCKGEFIYIPNRVDGLEQLRRFKGHGISCPEFTIDIAVARKWVNEGSDVFGRDKDHQKGRDIVDQGSPSWAKKDFWSKVIPVTKEYRLHIFDDQHIQQGLKCFDQNATKQRTDGLAIRNTETGWRIYDHSFKPLEKAIKLAKQAVQVLGYLWGAVDLLEDANGNCYVLEVNTVPGMDNTTANAYANAIKGYVQNRSANNAL